MNFAALSISDLTRHTETVLRQAQTGGVQYLVSESGDRGVLLGESHYLGLINEVVSSRQRAERAEARVGGKLAKDLHSLSEKRKRADEEIEAEKKKLAEQCEQIRKARQDLKTREQEVYQVRNEAYAELQKYKQACAHADAIQKRPKVKESRMRRVPILEASVIELEAEVDRLMMVIRSFEGKLAAPGDTPVTEILTKLRKSESALQTAKRDAAYFHDKYEELRLKQSWARNLVEMADRGSLSLTAGQKQMVPVG